MYSNLTDAAFHCHQLQFIAVSQVHFPEKICDWEDFMGNRGLWERQSLLTLRTCSLKKHRKILVLCWT